MWIWQYKHKPSTIMCSQKPGLWLPYTLILCVFLSVIDSTRKIDWAGLYLVWWWAALTTMPVYTQIIYIIISTFLILCWSFCSAVTSAWRWQKQMQSAWSICVSLIYYYVLFRLSMIMVEVCMGGYWADNRLVSPYHTQASMLAADPYIRHLYVRGYKQLKAARKHLICIWLFSLFFPWTTCHRYWLLQIKNTP